MKKVIENFYDAFNKLDVETMISYYHEDIVFEDAAFGILKGNRAKLMWKMLCESQQEKNFKVVVSEIKANTTDGSAHWEAFYTFSKTGRKVHNKINATFKFKDGLIINHTDNFSLHKWATQALGIKGFLFGGMSFFRLKLQKQTNNLLDNYITKKAI